MTAGDEPEPRVASVVYNLQRLLGAAAQPTKSEAAARRVFWGDDDIAEAAAARLGWHGVDASYQVEVYVDEGWITLGGCVDWQFQKDAAGQLAQRLLGVIGVTNHIQVRPEPLRQHGKPVRTG